MNIENLLNSVSYRFVTEDSYQSVVYAAGIDWNLLPDTALGVQVAKKYLVDLKETQSHEHAAHSVKDELAILERAQGKYNAPNKHEVLSVDFDKALNLKQYKLLGEALIQNPEQGKDLVERFNPGALDAVVSRDMVDTMIELNISHAKKLREKKLFVSIPGFELLSKMIGGFNPGRLTILTGRSGFGKTNLGLNLAMNAQKSFPVTYINMEMGYDDIFKRIAVMLMGWKYRDLGDSQHYNESKVNLKILETLKDHFTMTNGESLSTKEIFSLVRVKNSEMKKSDELLIIDYDQRLSLNIKTAEQEWQQILNSVKSIEDFAKREKLHVILMCQLNQNSGNIASSQRILNVAHSWLDFYNSDQGPLIHARKSRHGITNHGIRVKYESSKIEEIVEVVVKDA